MGFLVWWSYLTEGFPEVFAQESVQDRIDAGIHVGQDLTDDLHDDVDPGDFVPAEAFEQQDHLQHEKNCNHKNEKIVSLDHTE